MSSPLTESQRHQMVVDILAVTQDRDYETLKMYLNMFRIHLDEEVLDDAATTYWSESYDAMQEMSDEALYRAWLHYREVGQCGT